MLAVSGYKRLKELNGVLTSSTNSKFTPEKIMLDRYDLTPPLYGKLSLCIIVPPPLILNFNRILSFYLRHVTV